MSEKLTNQAAPVLAENITPEWIAERRAIILRDGHAVRASVHFPVIEVQSINDPELWIALCLPGNTPLFATNFDRDTILFKLWGSV